MGLNLSRRSAKIGNTITVNTQKHGDDDVMALYIPLSQIAITAEELPELCLEPKAYKLLYRKWKGRPDQPIWGKLSAGMKLNGKVKGVSATLFLGRRQLKLSNATSAKMFLGWGDGGVSQFELQLQCVPDMDENHPIMEILLSKVNQQIDVELEASQYGAQLEMPLEEAEDDEDEDEEQENAEQPLPGEEEAEDDEDEDEEQENAEQPLPGEDEPELSGKGRQIVDAARRGRRRKK